MVRRATADDLLDLLTLGESFHAGSPYRDLFAWNGAQIERMVGWLLEHGAIFVAEKDGASVGMLGVAVAPHLMSGDLMASEVFWWVEPRARGLGLKLLRAAERWARAEGATVLQLVAPDAAARTLYERLGFVQIETAYQRTLETSP